MANSSDNSDRAAADDGYKVGYGNPPREHQFKLKDGRERSSKRSGKHVSTGASVAARLDKPLTVTQNGKVTKHHPHKFQMMSLGKRALKGEPRPMSEFLKECLDANLLDPVAVERLSHVVEIPDGVNTHIVHFLITHYGRPPWDPAVYNAANEESLRDLAIIAELRRKFSKEHSS